MTLTRSVSQDLLSMGIALRVFVFGTGRLGGASLAGVRSFTVFR